MKRFTATALWALALAFVLFSSRPVFGQDIVIGAGSSFHGSGTYNVHGNIDNSGTTNTVDTLRGRINLVGTIAPEVLGATVPLHIDTLVAAGTTSKTMNVPVTAGHFTVDNGAANAFNVNGQTLILTGGADVTSGALNAAGASDKVVYNGAASQAVIGTTYGNLQLANAGTKSLSGAVVAADLTHTGGALTVNNPLTVINTASIATIADVTGTGSLHSKGSTTIDSLVANSGAVTADSGSVTFAHLANNTAGNLKATNNGDLKFQTKLHNNGTLAADVNGKAWFSDSVTGSGTYNFDSLSTVYYEQASGTQEVVPTTYGSIVLTNSAKSLADNSTAKGSIQLDQNLNVASGKALTMTSSNDTNVHGTGSVFGRVNRTNDFAAKTLYAFNSANVRLALDSAVSGGSMGLTLLPDSNIIVKPSVRYAKRSYAFASSGLGTAKLRGISLTYADAELQGGVKESKLSVREYSSSWSKLSTPGTPYFRSVDTTSNVVFIDSIAAPLAGVNEFALVNLAFGTKQSGLWAAASTWDEGAVPDSLEDAEINPTHIVTVGSDAGIASVSLIDSTAGLTIGTGSLAVSGPLDNLGTITVGTGSAKSLSVGADFTNRRKLIVSPLATLSTVGKLRNFGDVTNDGIIDIGQ